jgi:hypothetical protein
LLERRVIQEVEIVGYPNTPAFALPSNFIFAAIPFLIALLVVLLIPSSFLRLASLLVGAIVAIVAALIHPLQNAFVLARCREQGRK